MPWWAWLAVGLGCWFVVALAVALLLGRLIADPHGRGVV